MQKWSPEPFDVPGESPALAVAEPPGFEATAAVLGSKTTNATASQFRSESGFTDTKSLMNSLTAEERAQVYELVQIDVADEYEEREQKLRDEFDQRLAELEQTNDRRFAAWTDRISAVLAEEVQGAAVAAADMAVQIAGKIVRRSVSADPEVLVRAIEATIYKIAANEPLTIRANRADAEWLGNRTELLERLNIGEIIADRRIEAGGCLIQCQGREWDATLTRQFGSLEDIVTEMLETAEPPKPLAVPEAVAVTDDPFVGDEAAGTTLSTETEAPDDSGLE